MDKAAAFAPLTNAERTASAQLPKKPEWCPILPVPENLPPAPARHYKLGTHTAEWSYRDAGGRLFGYVRRFDPSGERKQVIPLTWCECVRDDDHPENVGKREWRWLAFDEPRPLYNLDKLAARPDALVLVPEGEKSADAAARLFPDAVTATSSGGANAAHVTDWSPLAGRQVALWPDADEHGTKYAAEVARLAVEVGAAQVRVIAPPAGVKEGWDAADALAEGWTRERVATLLDEAKAWEPPAAEQEPAPNGTDEQTIARLAAMSPLDYDRCREAEAERLGVRLGTLDATVKQARPKAEEATDATGFAEVELWSAPVDGAALLDEIVTTVQRFVVCTVETARAAALWCVMTWFMDVVGVAPIAAITSPEKRCGKTVFLTVLNRLSFRALAASNISPAALFRVVEALTPTLLIDEADSFLKDNEELRGVINSGHTRDTAYVFRCEGEELTPKRFSTWGAKALAAIGNLPDTHADRAIPLELRRKLPTDHVDRLRYAEAKLFDTLRAKLARWAEDHRETIRHARPALPEALHDRAQDNFEPLLAIADTAGGEWPKLAREAALKLYGAEPATLSVGVELLRDIKAVWTDDEAHIATATLIERLTADPELRWASYNRGAAITPRQLAARLRPYGIRSKNVREGASTVAKGYAREQFTEAWDRYLPRTTPVSSATTLQRNSDNGLCEFRSATEGGSVAEERRPNLLVNKECSVVADRKGEAGAKGGDGTVPPLDDGYLAAVLADPEADLVEELRRHKVEILAELTRPALPSRGDVDCSSLQLAMGQPAVPAWEEVTTWPLSEVDRRRLRLKIRSRLLGCDLWLVAAGDTGPGDGLPCYTTDEVRELLKLTAEDLPAKVQAIHLAKLSFGPAAVVEEVIPS